MHRHQWNYFVANVKQKMSGLTLEEKQRKIDANTFDSQGKCLFCRLALEDVLFRDSDVAVFRDIKQDARSHLLVVPIEHIPNVLYLNQNHVALIQKMLQVGQMVLKSLGDGEFLFGFHHPPINSIDHLHMHAIQKPIFSFTSKLSYSKYLWFITADQVISRLEAGRRPILFMRLYEWNSFVASMRIQMRYSSLAEKERKVNENTYDDEGRCLFCKLAQGEVLYRDSEIAVFKDKKKDSRCHLLVVPVTHIPNILHLRRSDIPLVLKMVSIATSLLRSLSEGEEDFIFGFHHPPTNSIGHMHMHAIQKPIFSFKSKLSYSKYLWFISADQVISRLESGHN